MGCAIQNSAPTLVSLFTGAGGLDVGLETAGFSTTVAVDNDPACIESLRLNQAKGVLLDDGRSLLRETKLVCSSVSDLSAGDLRPQGCGPEWAPDLLAGGPPCQPFSSAGKMLSINEPRGRLFEDFIRLATALRPRFVLFENVRGLVTARGARNRPGEVLELIRRSFEEIGYATRFALLNAADYGLPQRRVRLFMLGSRGSPLPDFPRPTHGPVPSNALSSEFQPWKTLGEFLKGRPQPDPDDIECPSARLEEALRDVTCGSGLKSPGARETTRPGGHWGYKQGTFVADLARPARTVTAASTQDWVRIAGSLRRLTWRECAALQGFPEQWVFAGSKADRFRQIGNAVPVIFGHVLGDKIANSRPVFDEAVLPKSAPWPDEFVEAIRYTQKDHMRNGASRRKVVELQALGLAAQAGLMKGLGSMNGVPDAPKTQQQSLFPE